MLERQLQRAQEGVHKALTSAQDAAADAANEEGRKAIAAAAREKQELMACALRREAKISQLQAIIAEMSASGACSQAHKAPCVPNVAAKIQDLLDVAQKLVGRLNLVRCRTEQHRGRVLYSRRGLALVHSGTASGKMKTSLSPCKSRLSPAVGNGWTEATPTKSFQGGEDSPGSRPPTPEMPPPQTPQAEKEMRQRVSGLRVQVCEQCMLS